MMKTPAFQKIFDEFGEPPAMTVLLVKILRIINLVPIPGF